MLSYSFYYALQDRVSKRILANKYIRLVQGAPTPLEDGSFVFVSTVYIERVFFVNGISEYIFVFSLFTIFFKNVTM